MSCFIAIGHKSATESTLKSGKILPTTTPGKIEEVRRLCQPYLQARSVIALIHVAHRPGCDESIGEKKSRTSLRSGTSALRRAKAPKYIARLRCWCNAMRRIRFGRTTRDHCILAPLADRAKAQGGVGTFRPGAGVVEWRFVSSGVGSREEKNSSQKAA